MTNTVDFNRYRPPILRVPLMDKAETVLHVTPPTVDLQEELRARLPELTALLTGGEDEQRAALYDLAARLMSCNRNMRTITAADLRGKYHMDEEDLVVFFNEYASFVRGIENLKN
jgi:hypothetical protein